MITELNVAKVNMIFLSNRYSKKFRQSNGNLDFQKFQVLNKIKGKKMGKGQNYENQNVESQKKNIKSVKV